MAANQARRRAATLYVRAALLVGLAAPLLVLAGAIGTKVGWWPWQTGFGQVAVGWGSLAAKIGTGTGLLALVVAFVDFRRLAPLALLALVAPGLTLAGFAKLRAEARSLPPIHDVATDWVRPLSFSERMTAQRADALNPVEADPRVPADADPRWAGRRIAEINAETCPGARAIPRMVPPERVREVLEREDVQVIGVAPWRVEGTHESFWFGFKDDVVVRIEPGRTDIRSVSRVGASDLGANCRRVTRIVQALSE